MSAALATALGITAALLVAIYGGIVVAGNKWGPPLSSRRFYTRHAVACTIHSLALLFLIGFGIYDADFSTYSGVYWISPSEWSFEPVTWKYRCAYPCLVVNESAAGSEERRFHAERDASVPFDECVSDLLRDHSHELPTKFSIGEQPCTDKYILRAEDGQTAEVSNSAWDFTLPAPQCGTSDTCPAGEPARWFTSRNSAARIETTGTTPEGTVPPISWCKTRCSTKADCVGLWYVVQNDTGAIGCILLNALYETEDNKFKTNNLQPWGQSWERVQTCATGSTTCSVWSATTSTRNVTHHDCSYDTCPDDRKQFYTDPPDNALQPNVLALASFYVAWSAIGHAVVWRFGKWHRLVRWIDYSLTAPVMLVVLGLVFGTSSTWSLVSPGLLSLLLVAAGFVERPEGEKSPGIQSTRGAVFVVLVLLYALVLTPILYASVRITMSDAEPAAGSDGTGKAPDFVPVFAGLTALLFSAFVVPYGIDLLAFPLDSREAIYVTLSLIAKTCLHLWLGLTIIQTAATLDSTRPEDNEVRSEMETLGYGLGGAAGLIVAISLLSAFGRMYDDSVPTTGYSQVFIG